MADPLDNVVWHALAGPHATFAIGRGKARHYPRDVAPFSALEEPTAAAYADLARDLAANTEARLFRPSEEPLPAGWAKVDAFPVLQMIAPRPACAVETSKTPSRLTAADIAAILELVSIAEPGPFGPRTLELGSYLGVHEKGRLVAMAGERMRLAGYVELSAICTRPEARGRGLATDLTVRLMNAAYERGEIPFLHVRSENTAAVSLYRRLGFDVRRELWVLWRIPKASPT
jgi:ribosomal protein S18 acetylase RimI-like enzyme